MRADVGGQRRISGGDDLPDDAFADDQRLAIDVGPGQSERGHVAVIDRGDAAGPSVAAAQDDRRPVAEDFGDALGDGLRDPGRIDVAGEERAGVGEDLRALGLHLHLLFEGAALGDVAERHDDAGGRPSSCSGVALIETATRSSVARDEDGHVLHRPAGGKRLRGGQLLRIEQAAVLVAQPIDFGLPGDRHADLGLAEQALAGGIDEDRACPSPSTSSTPSDMPAIIASVRRTWRMIDSQKLLLDARTRPARPATMMARPRKTMAIITHWRTDRDAARALRSARRGAAR